jgi:hypothetical protein
LGGASTAEVNGLGSVPQAAWDRLSRRRIYFGHQSVGYNILAGVADLLAANPGVRLRLTESADPAEMNEPGLTHSRIGSNSDPSSKLHAFSNFLLAGAGERCDAAFFKLCYADIGPDSDPAAIFAEYERVLHRLSLRFSNVRFLHVTVPLTALPTGCKQRLKKLLGRPLWGYEHNRRREAFNKLMRRRYSGENAIFDIAAIESTRPDGTPETFTWKGDRHAAMYRGYTFDHGHLGELGRSVVAAPFLVWLAGAVS